VVQLSSPRVAQLLLRIVSYSARPATWYCSWGTMTSGNIPITYTHHIPYPSYTHHIPYPSYTIPIIYHTHHIPITYPSYTIPIIYHTHHIPIIYHTHHIPIIYPSYTKPIIYPSYTVQLFSFKVTALRSTFLYISIGFSLATVAFYMKKTVHHTVI
jgi:hypothetical protein